MTRKKAREKLRSKFRASGGLRAWFDRLETERRLKAAFNPSKRPSRVRCKESDECSHS